VPARVLASIAALLALAFASCGDDAGSGDASVTDFIPADSPMVLEASRASDEQVANAEGLIERLGEVPLLGSTLDPRELAEQAIDESAAESGADISFAEDIEPWLGDRAAIGFTSIQSLIEEELTAGEVAPTADEDPDFVIAIETSDEQIAGDSIDRLMAAGNEGEIVEEEVGGRTVRRVEGDEVGVAVVDGVLVVGNTDAALEGAFEAYDGDSLADSDEYEAAFEGLPEERLASGYIDFATFVELAAVDDPAALEAVRALYGDAFDQPFALSLTAGESSLALDVSGGAVPFSFPTPSPSDLLASAPGDSLAALGFDDVGGQLRGLYDAILGVGVETMPGADPDLFLERLEAELGVSLDEVTAAFGDGAAYLRGELPDSYSVGFELDLPAGTDTPSALLDRVEAELERNGWTVGPPLGSGAEGLSAENRRAEEIRFLNVEITEDVATVSAAPDRETAEAAAASAGDELGDSDLYAGAEALLGDEHDLIGLADPGTIIEQASAGGSLLDVVTGQSSPEQVVADFLAQRLDVAALGLRESDDRLYQRLVVGIE
jgi:Protein of unknown function (DUF3352)